MDYQIYIYSQLKSPKRSKLENIIHFIEIEMNSNLRSLIISRMTHKILNTRRYFVYSLQVKIEIRKLRKLVSYHGITLYLQNLSKHMIQRDPIANKALNKTVLRYLLWQREIVRDTNKIKYQQTCNQLIAEWRKLAKVFPPENIIQYSRKILDIFHIFRNNSKLLR